MSGTIKFYLGQYKGILKLQLYAYNYFHRKIYFTYLTFCIYIMAMMPLNWKNSALVANFLTKAVLIGKYFIIGCM